MMQAMKRRRFFMASADASVPFYIESIGYNPYQELIIRDEGYPCFHWLQTEAGEGEIVLQEQTLSLPPYHGVLIAPRTPHRYNATKDHWSTYYLTFEGPLAASLIAQLGMQHSFIYKWEPTAGLNELLDNILSKILTQHDLTGLEHSTELYRFLVQLKKFGIVNKQPSIYSVIGRLQPLLEWLESAYANPEIGTVEMAEILEVSPRHLNSLFRQAFGNTPYQFLLQYRMQKAKHYIVAEQEQPIRSISAFVGFKDVSHFVATFRRMEGITPDQFRKLHGQ